MSQRPEASYDRALRDLTAQLATCATPAEAAERTVDALARAGLDMPSVYFEQGGRLRCAAVRGCWQVLDGIPVRDRTGRSSRAFPDLSTLAALDAVPGVTAGSCLPLRHAGDVCGVLNVTSRAPLPREAVAFAAACAAALERGVAELGGPPRESAWQRFGRVSAALNECQTREEVLDLALQAACDLMDTRSATVVLGGSRSGDERYRAAAVIGPLGEALVTIPSRGLASIAAWTRKAAAVYTFGDPADRGLFGHRYLREAGVASIAAVALAGGGETHGFLLAADVEPARPSAEQSERFELLGAHVAAALQRVDSLARLRRQAQRDPLTALGHKAAFHTALAAHRDGVRPVAVCLVDLDGFKEINDTEGHGAGDELLVRVARSLAGAVRGSDRVFRVGGDEFAALVPVAGDADALSLARRLCAAVRRCGRVTGSVGVALAAPANERDGVTVVASPLDRDGVAVVARAADADSAAVVAPADAHSAAVVAPADALSAAVVVPPDADGVPPAADRGDAGAPDPVADADLALYEAKRQGGDRAVAFHEGLRSSARDGERLSARR